MTPLFIAATYGYVDICRRLIDNGADIIAVDESQQTPLHRAAAEGHNVRRLCFIVYCFFSLMMLY